MLEPRRGDFPRMLRSCRRRSGRGRSINIKLQPHFQTNSHHQIKTPRQSPRPNLIPYIKDPSPFPSLHLGLDQFILIHCYRQYHTLEARLVCNAENLSGYLPGANAVRCHESYQMLFPSASSLNIPPCLVDDRTPIAQASLPNANIVVYFSHHGTSTAPGSPSSVPWSILFFICVH